MSSKTIISLAIILPIIAIIGIIGCNITPNHVDYNAIMGLYFTMVMIGVPLTIFTWIGAVIVTHEWLYGNGSYRYGGSKDGALRYSKELIDRDQGICKA